MAKLNLETKAQQIAVVLLLGLLSQGTWAAACASEIHFYSPPQGHTASGIPKSGAFNTNNCTVMTRGQLDMPGSSKPLGLVWSMPAKDAINSASGMPANNHNKISTWTIDKAKTRTTDRLTLNLKPIAGHAYWMTNATSDTYPRPGHTLAQPSHHDKTGNQAPVLAAIWLFGSGLLGLAGISRKRRTSQEAAPPA